MATVHTYNDLRQLQALPLPIKVAMTQTRIRAWVSEYGVDGVYVSFSGGKDSTVLLDIARKIYPDIQAVYIDTGLEYPEVRQFALSGDNVIRIKPKMNFRQVIEKYGYPMISKETSECVQGARKYLTSIMNDSTIAKTDRQTDRQTDSRILTNTINLEELASTLNERMKNRQTGSNQRLAIMLGMLTKDQTIKANIPEKDKSTFSQEKYAFFLDAPFEISNRCCAVMKKEPAHRYAKDTGRKPITAQMACESRLRLQKWLQFGCNAFESKNPISNPMSFWTEQDVLQYIKENNIEIASVYGDIVYDDGDQLEGQIDLADLGLAKEVRQLKTTGCDRTGCMFCGFGCHLEKSPNRFERMKETHPKLYDYIMKPWDKGGLGYKDVIDWINEHGNMNIKY